MGHRHRLRRGSRSSSVRMRRSEVQEGFRLGEDKIMKSKSSSEEDSMFVNILCWTGRRSSVSKRAVYVGNRSIAYDTWFGSPITEVKVR